MIDPKVSAARAAAIQNAREASAWVSGWLSRYNAAIDRLEAAETYAEIAKAAAAADDAIPGGDTFEVHGFHPYRMLNNLKYVEDGGMRDDMD